MKIRSLGFLNRGDVQRLAISMYNPQNEMFLKN